jgi:restriction system protein
LEHGSDPGASGVPAQRTPSLAERAEERELHESGLLDPAAAPTLDAIRDRIRMHIVENFSGHKLTGLVADILTAMGYVCFVSPPGADGGVDILAGRGPLGLDSPTLVVEVKSEPTPIGTQVARGLQGAVSNNQADQGLLVAWGGINSSVRREFAQQRTKMAFWSAEDLLGKLFSVYPQLPDQTRAALPLKMAWVLDEEMGAV